MKPEDSVRSIGELMKELGFNKEAPVEIQKAFIRHLIQAAQQQTPPRNNESTDQSPMEPKQLCFDLESPNPKAG